MDIVKHPGRAALALLLALTGAAWGGAFVTYEEFGAAGDGKADDQKAIVAAHAAANSRNVPVKAAAKTYRIGGGAAPAVIRTDVDFGKAKFIIDDTRVEKRGTEVFRVEASAKPVPVKGLKTLVKGQKKLGVKLSAPSLVLLENSDIKRYIRAGGNRNSGAAQQEVVLVAANGAVDPRTPLIWDYPAVTRAMAYPLEAKPLTIKGGTFVTIANQGESRYDYHTRGFAVNRSNVTIRGMRHEVTGEGDHGAPYNGFIAVALCAEVTVRDSVFTGHRTYTTTGSGGGKVSMGSYDLTVNRAANVSFINCTQTNDILDTSCWGIFSSNYSKNLLYDGCVLSRFDAHMGVANATILNSRLGHVGINAIGCGTFRVEKTTVCSSSFFNLRQDYGSTWEGEFLVKDCVFIPGGGRRATTGILINGAYDGTHDFGYPCFMPRRIVFDGLKIDDSQHPGGYGGPWIFSVYNKNYKEGYTEKYPYTRTEEVVLRKVVTKSGKPLRVCANEAMFKGVKVTK